MTLKEARGPLLRLLETLGQDPCFMGGPTREGCSWVQQRTPGIVGSDRYAEHGGPVYLGIDSDRAYRDCLSQLLKEVSVGELEHLTAREAEAALWELVSQAWSYGSGFTLDARRKLVKSFINRYRKPHEKWEVAWEIADLNASVEFSIGNVDFRVFREEDWANWIYETIPVFEEVKTDFMGRTFGTVTVLAGAQKSAVDRGALAVDEALEFMRYGADSHRFVRVEELRQTRGIRYFVRPTQRPQEGSFGGKREHNVYLLEARQDLVDELNSSLKDFALMIAPKSKFDLSLRRALLWYGSSFTRRDLDSALLDLCTALECVLASRSDTRKAETLAIRYMLLAYAVSETAWDIHPLSLYDLYLLRNEVIHGSARRVATETDVGDLRLAVREVLGWIPRLAAAEQGLNSISTLHQRIQSTEALKRILASLDQFKEAEAGKTVLHCVRLMLGDAGQDSQKAAQ